MEMRDPAVGRRPGQRGRAVRGDVGQVDRQVLELDRAGVGPGQAAGGPRPSRSGDRPRPRCRRAPSPPRDRRVRVALRCSTLLRARRPAGSAARGWHRPRTRAGGGGELTRERLADRDERTPRVDAAHAEGEARPRPADQQDGDHCLEGPKLDGAVGPPAPGRPGPAARGRSARSGSGRGRRWCRRPAVRTSQPVSRAASTADLVGQAHRMRRSGGPTTDIARLVEGERDVGDPKLQPVRRSCRRSPAGWPVWSRSRTTWRPRAGRCRCWRASRSTAR